MKAGTKVRTYERVKQYNKQRLGTFNYTAQCFLDEPGMRRGHMPHVTAREWINYVNWCAGFEKMMGY